MNYRSVHNLSRLVAARLGKLPAGIEGVVGIPRSGTLVADMIGLQLSLPVMTVGDVCAQSGVEVGTRMHMTKEAKRDFLRTPRRLLVVDDSCGTGGTMKSVKRALADAPVKHDCTYMAAYVNAAGAKWVDVWLEIVEKPRFFEWNWVSRTIGSLCAVFRN